MKTEKTRIMKDKIGIPLLQKTKVQYQIQTKNINKEGRLYFDDQIELRNFTQKLNEGKDLIYNSSKAATAGELNAVQIITSLTRKIINRYSTELNKNVTEKADQFLTDEIGEHKVENLVKSFKAEFVTSLETENLNELLLIWMINQNKAFGKYVTLFNDDVLKTESNYPVHFELLKEFFKVQIPVYKNFDLISFLLQPMIQFPNSIFDQLNFIKNHWKDLIDDELFLLLQGIDLLKEENKIHFTGPGPAQIHQFDDEEYENFTEDKDWMPHLVLLAKSTYVWLEQLSKKYKVEVSRLDQIPQEELQLQASRGITGIWLIGIWQRSEASKRLKEINGDLDAIASAYSLDDYRIADDLGGDVALEELKRKAAGVGIRIGCDMVPNHTGIDSNWLVNHPEWFIQLDQPPFPNYSFNGENLSMKNEIQVRIEDHYYEKTDAAVVFQFIKDGNIRYIYHGNDGTSTPWNDTAQLNYLLPEVRKAVSDTIIAIARKFPIIRFDAAMTLAKKHIQRLWFPQPGAGGDIATRSEFGMTKHEFDKIFPKEFWREVVDRAALEAPDTLFLAEAFWMMEGYFVRTLGMHRVYNSAFMNMLKAEENAKYRKSIFNILEFNPQILKRFVNFMSNPDEDTAIAQFGRDDKYFGVCLLMSTMPGLPMYAHGQIEGFTERYGMEFKKAKWQENEDEGLIERHNREIFPLLNRRYLFSDVENFILFDFITNDNDVNENVFAYTNRFEDQSSLVVYNNKFQETSGWINWANIPKQEEDKTVWTRKNLGSAWELHNDPGYFVIIKDEISDLEFIRNSREVHEKGLFQNLPAFKYAVYLNIYEIKDNAEKHYSRLAEYLQGGGTENIQYALKRLELLPLLSNFNSYFDWNVLTQLMQITTRQELNSFSAELKSRIEDFLQILKNWVKSDNDISEISQLIIEDLSLYCKQQKDFALSDKENLFCISWILMRHLGRLKSKKNYALISFEWLDELFFGDEMKHLTKIDININLLKIGIQFQNLWKLENSVELSLKKIFHTPAVKQYLMINEYDNKLWYNQEAFDELFDTLEIVNLISIGKKITKKKNFKSLIDKIRKAAESSEYQVEELIENILEV